MLFRSGLPESPGQADTTSADIDIGGVWMEIAMDGCDADGLDGNTETMTGRKEEGGKAILLNHHQSIHVPHPIGGNQLTRQP